MYYIILQRPSLSESEVQMSSPKESIFNLLTKQRPGDKKSNIKRQELQELMNKEEGRKLLGRKTEGATFNESKTYLS